MSRVRGRAADRAVDKVAVITGAGSGIGRQLAFALARRGARLAVSDVNDPGLAETADRLRALGVDAHAARLDVSDRAAVRAYATRVAEHFGVVHQIYCNAGVAGGGRSVLDADWAAYDRTLAVNLFGVIHTATAFLPHLIASGAGHVVTISSLNGIMGQPALSDYCAAKFAVRGFTETLRAEMALAGHPVRVTVVHPGGVRTNIASAALDHAERHGTAVTEEARRRVRTYNERLLRMPAERAARVIVDGVEEGRPRVLVGADARIADLLVRLAPSLYPALIARLERRLFGTS
ncbi:SDR family NAD(P)-dependent oxidoreductase [Streptoalloteichus hindustanus]|uniref:Short-chain dehydrogenase n=1 Tax=Streptoalloteichus hindustanus TaxID=2017 RepID=A0A1M5I3L6_STRHI|nr:SDR family NAD(P)-dependent oxidoreductase [Streptoalloteichus hindustanus]SHG22822.1 Short-chain dehydrogenase [Streptoalloteichus hindustanus]